MNEELKKKLIDIKKDGLRRSLTEIEGEQGRVVTVDGKELLLFSSNDYLGLASHPLVKEAMIEGVKKYGAGSGASRLVSGTMTPHRELEERLALFKGTEKAILFNSGYQANTGAIPALVGRGDEIFSDKLNHASLIDGAILSRARLRRYAHRDMSALNELLKSSTAKRKLITTDSLFSMDGTLAPIAEIVELAEKHDATIYLDDAHGVGVLGPGGRGGAAAFGIENHPRIIEMGTLGKAFGTAGAFITGSNELIDFLINKARTFIYSTALPPSLPHAAIAAIDIAERDPARRQRVVKNSARLRMGLADIKLDPLGGKNKKNAPAGVAHIIPLILGSEERATSFSKELLGLGIFVQAIRPPTVAKGSARLRVTITSEHTEDDIEKLLKSIEEVAARE